MSTFKNILNALGLLYMPDKDALLPPDIQPGQPRTTLQTADVPNEIVKGTNGVLYKSDLDDAGQFAFSYSIWKGQKERTASNDLADRCEQVGVKLSTVLRIKPLFEQGLTQEAIVNALDGEPGFKLRTVQKAWAVLSPTQQKNDTGTQPTRKKAKLRKASLIISKL